MKSEIFPYIVLVAMSATLSTLLALYAYIRRNVFLFSTTFILSSVFSAIYSLGHALEMASSSLSEINFWLKFQYLGMPFIAPTSLILVIKYMGYDHLVKVRNCVLLFAIPAVTSLMVLTNEWHHLFYRSVYFIPNENVHLVDIEAGPWYIIHGCYTFGIIMLTTLLLFWYLLQTKASYWKQTVTLIIAQVIPMTASFLYLNGMSPYNMDPVPIVMCITSALYLWAIQRSKLFLLSPIARDRIFESIQDAVIVIDATNRIVDFNDAATRLASKLSHASLGEPFQSVWDDQEQFALTESLSQSTEEQKFESYACKSDRYYQVRIIPVSTQYGKFIGTTIMISDITEQKQLEFQLTQMAYLDGMTQIYNRTYFMEKSSDLFTHAKQTSSPLSLILFDIDHFKNINDRYGHSVGDLAICHVVQLCEHLLSPDMIFSRYGGEEFVICLPNIALNDATMFAEKLRETIASTPLQTEKGNIPITSSFGVSEMTSRTASLDLLLQEADQALYKSKEHGRNLVTTADKNAFVHAK